MRKKSFEAGIEAGAKPHEEKFQKQSDAFHKVGDRLDGHLDVIEDKVDIVIDDGLARERKEVFGLNTLFDIKNMDDTEKILVVSLMYALAQKFEANDYQKNYIRSVQKYLELKNIQPVETLTGVEGVKDIDSQKAILQVIMEYLFLEGFSFDFLDEEAYEDLFDSFNVNRKGFREVEIAIENIYQAVGADGLAEKYGAYGEDEVVEQSAMDVPPIEELEEMQAEAENLFLNYKVREALELFDKLAAFKYAKAMYFAAEIYAQGFGLVTIDKEKAAVLRQEGHELGNILCSLNYAFSIKDSEEKKKVVQKYMTDVVACAKAGNIFAQYEVAAAYHKGSGVNKNSDTALMWLNRSADFWLSKYALASYYYTGTSVSKDKVKAAEMWREVAEIGYPKAAHNFYYCVKDRLNLSKEVADTAFGFITRCAELKMPASQYLLAEIYLDGPASNIFMEQVANESKATKVEKGKNLLSSSAERGQQDAVKKLNLLESGKKIGYFSWQNVYYLW